MSSPLATTIMEELNGDPAVEILKVFATVDKETGEQRFAWKYGRKLNLYTMIGVLDSIKHDLLSQLQENTFKETEPL